MITAAATTVTAITTAREFETFVDQMARALVAVERDGTPESFDLDFEKAVHVQAQELRGYLLARLDAEHPARAAALREVIDISD